MSVKLTIGADPEFFLTRGYSPVSAHNLVPGTKKAPVKVDGGAVQADGTAVEFNIDPASTGEEFKTNITKVLTHLRKTIPNDYQFNFSPYVHYPIAYFRTLPETATELGCEPDFDAYRNGERNPIPANAGLMARTASGHLHLGWTSGANVEDPDHLADCMAVVRRLDYYFSGVNGLWETTHDGSRRGYYGNYGAFRPKSYGVEYRTLGPTWLKYPKLWPWLFEYSKHAFESLMQGIGDDDLPIKPPPAKNLSKNSEGLPDLRNAQSLRNTWDSYYALTGGDSSRTNYIPTANSTIKKYIPKGAPLIPADAFSEVFTG